MCAWPRSHAGGDCRRERRLRGQREQGAGGDAQRGGGATWRVEELARPDAGLAAQDRPREEGIGSNFPTRTYNSL
eukprot:1377240-Pleurochrysis_carterae.AAC.1